MTETAARGLADPAWYGDLWAYQDRADIWHYGVSTEDDASWASTYAEEALESLSTASDYEEPRNPRAWRQAFAAAYRRRAVMLYEGREGP